MGAVLVVRADDTERESLLSGLAQLGQQVLVAATPLDAVWQLEHHGREIHTAFVARFVGDKDGREVVNLMSARYPDISRILTNPQNDLDAAEAHCVLTRCDPTRLRQVLPS